MGDRDRQCAWLTEMQTRRSKTIDVPSWLWRAVVDLVGVHERAYLEHCRRYALEHDKAETPAAE